MVEIHQVMFQYIKRLIHQGIFQDIKRYTRERSRTYRDIPGNVPGHIEIYQGMFQEIKRYTRECSRMYRDIPGNVPGCIEIYQGIFQDRKRDTAGNVPGCIESGAEKRRQDRIAKNLTSKSSKRNPKPKPYFKR